MKWAAGSSASGTGGPALALESSVGNPPLRVNAEAEKELLPALREL